jgi:hypothetical protein
MLPPIATEISPRFYDPLEYWERCQPPLLSALTPGQEDLRRRTAQAMEEHGVHGCYGLQCKLCHPRLHEG